MANFTREQFTKITTEALESLPARFKEKINNVAIFVEDRPTAEQLAKVKLRDSSGLFGLFEGFAQARRLNFGPVLPDRITIFRLAILKHSADAREVKDKIISTLKHEIAHHFGSDERGAAKASKSRDSQLASRNS